MTLRAGAEDLAHLGAALDDLDLLGLEHARAARRSISSVSL